MGGCQFIRKNREQVINLLSKYSIKLPKIDKKCFEQEVIEEIKNKRFQMSIGLKNAKYMDMVMTQENIKLVTAALKYYKENGNIEEEDNVRIKILLDILPVTG